MRLKIVLALLAVMGLICICCKNEDVAAERTIANEITVENVDSVAVDSLQVNW